MTSPSPPSSRVFSGIQPTGKLHLGNYLGAIRNWAKLQADHECIFCLVDLHAITVWQDPAELTANTREVTAAVIAGGIDPNRSILFNQSQVAGHAQLAWILNCVARLGWLNRMTQFKEKAGKDRENASVGLYTYPNLMAADILLYKTTHVPVGEDQKQHLELARDIAQKFNRDFGVELFPLPEPLIQGPAKRVMSLRDGTKKMSKSDPSDYSRLNIIDDADTIAAKLRKARTDPHLLPDSIEGLQERPEALNLLQVYAGLADEELPRAVDRFAGQTFAKFKEELIALAVTELAPIAAETRRLMADPDHLDAILRQGSERANQLARPILDEVFAVVGFVGAKSARD